MCLIELREKAKRLWMAIEQTKEIARANNGVELTDHQAALMVLEAINQSKNFETWLGLSQDQARMLLEMSD